MEKTWKCSRCGKINDISFKTINVKANCSHCHCEHIFSIETQKAVKIARMIMVGLYGILLGIAIPNMTNSLNVLVVVSLILLGILIMRYLHTFSMFIVFAIGKVSYIKYKK